MQAASHASGLDSPVPARPTNVRWMVFALSCGTSWILYLHRYTWNFVGPELQKQYGWSNKEVQTAYSLFNATYGFLQIPSGMLCDFMGPHFFLGVIIIVWSLATPLHGLPMNPFGMGATRLLYGATQAGAYPILAKVTRLWFPASYRTTIQGWVASFFGRFGGAMSPIIMGSLLMGYCKFSWQTSLAILGLVGVLFGSIFLVLFRNSPDVDPRVNEAERQLIHEGASPEETVERKVMPWKVALKNRSIRFLIIQQILVAGVDTIFVSLMVSYFLTKGVDIKAAGWLSSMPLWGGMLGGVLGAMTNDLLRWTTGSQRWGRSSVAVLSNSMACVLMLVTASQSNAVAAAWALFAVKVFSDMTQPTQWGTCTDIGGRSFSGTVFGIVNTAGNLGGFFLPIVFGGILDYYTTKQIVDGASQSITDYNPLFLYLAGMYLAGAACWLFIDCTQTLETKIED